MQAVQAVHAPRRVRPDGLRRTMTMSFVVHAAAVVVLFVIPRDWLKREEPNRISFSLVMGTPGEKTGGMNPAGGRQVETVAPPEKRPAPILPSSPPNAPAIAVPTKPPPKTPPRPVETPSTSTAPPRPPTTGAQKTPGSAPAETGVIGQGTGLSLGGGSGGTAQALDTNFCCPEYGEELIRRIRSRWEQTQAESGSNVVSFVIRRDGSFTDPEIVQSSGSVLLDIASRAAFRGLKLQPLPDKYKEETLTVRLKLEYKR